MSLFEPLVRWLKGTTPEPPAEQPSIPRPEILAQPEVDVELVDQVLKSAFEDEADDESKVLRVYTSGRYVSDDESSEAVGPKWDPYASEQSRAARVQQARRAKGRPEGPFVYDRWAVSPQKPPVISYYEILGVPRDSTVQQIERAYRRYAASIHPDRFFDDPKARAQAEEKMRELNGIMQILRDPGKRARYDATL